MTLWCAALFAAQLSSTTLSDVRLPAGESRDQVVAAEAGEYLSVAVEAKDFGVDAEVVMPDGAVMRRFGRLTPGRLTVTFVAPASGDYRIRLTAPRSSDGGQISIRIAERMSLEQRAAIRPTPLKGAVITALEQELKAGKMRDTTAFWNRIAGSRTPVVETLAETSDVQVTFLWRGTPDTRNVVVVGSLSLPPGFRNNVMSRLGDTDVWFLTKRLPAAARFVYGFAINGPLFFEGAPLAYMAAHREADPFNRVTAACGPARTRFDCLSVAELPGASPQPWILSSPATAKGTVSAKRVKSDRLQNERSVSVFTPAGYDASNADHDLLVLFDEGMYLSDVPAPTILDNLIAAQKIRPMIAVLVGNVNRDRELTPNPEFADFIEHELIPWVRANYRVSRDPRRVVIGGSSFGGLAAAYIAMRYPQTFGRVISLSGAFWWAPGASPGDPANAGIEPNWVAREYLHSPVLPLQFWMAAGTFETDPTGSGGAILETSRHLRDVLLARGYPVQYVQYPGGHDALSWRGLLAEALMALQK